MQVFETGMAAEIDARTWPLPSVFAWLAETGRIAPMEMGRTFNCGIGMVAVVEATAVERVHAALAGAGETVYRIGRIISRVEGAPGTQLLHLDAVWPR